MNNTSWKDIAVVFIIWTAVISVALIDFDNFNIFKG